MRRSTRTPSSCAGRSGSSRRTPCRGRLLLRHVDRHALRVARLEQLPEREREPLRLVVRRATGAERHREVEALAARRLHDRASPSWSSRSRSSSATRQQSTIVAGVARGRGRTPSRSGATGRRPSTGGVCSSSAARFASHTSVGSSSTSSPGARRRRRAATVGEPLRAVAAGSASRRTARRRRRPGARTRVGGRPCEVGEHHRRDPGVVVDHLGFVKPVAGYSTLSRLRERQLTGRSISTVDPELRPRPRRRSHIGQNGTLCRAAIWTGSISFGLVQVPVRMVAATTSKDVSFNQLEEGTGARIRYRRVSEADRRRGADRPDRQGLRGLEGPVRHHRGRRDRSRCGRRGAARSRSRSSSTSTRSTRSTSSSRTTCSRTSAA